MKITQDGIFLDREMSELDKFAVSFSSVLEKMTPYVIVSGYVSILLGRSRASEDIDMLIPEMDEEKWTALYERIVKNGYYCLNAGDGKAAYDILKSGIAVRFAPQDVVIPNMEILFASNQVQKLALSTSIKVRLGKNAIFVSDLELQIAYKEKALGSPKDLEDAKHIRLVLGDKLNVKKLNEFRKMIK
jgi:hypothetical protein